MPLPTFCMPRVPAMALPLTLLLAAGSAAADNTSNTLTVQFSQCTEFVGLAAVDATAARALVPAAYAPVVNAQGATLVVRDVRKGRICAIGLGLPT